VAAETIKLTAVGAAPPHVTYVKAGKEKFIPYINQRLKESGKDFKIEWTEAYSQTLAKFTEVLESVEGGVADVGLVLKNFEASKLSLEQVTSVARAVLPRNKCTVGWFKPDRSDTPARIRAR